MEFKDAAAPVVEDAADLLWVVNQDSVEIHPWLSRKENLDHPDLLVFDLDPGSRLPFQRLCEAATVVKEALDALGSSPERLPHVFSQPSWVAMIGKE